MSLFEKGDCEMKGIWIRSQDEKTLAYCHRLAIVGRIIQNLATTGIEDDYDIMGEYETPQRAIQVLNDIQNQICTMTNTVYQMPEK